jgi:hypothetical protein
MKKYIALWNLEQMHPVARGIYLARQDADDISLPRKTGETSSLFG